ncbi:MAG: hypothetical protein KKA79_03865, partial [Nanoarchaeota archaeon]|nr:hypothetical protein [Nanoarchaeota archaeon]
DNKEYEFTLSAVDSEGNKIDKKVKIKPIDRLAPGKIDFSVNPDSNKLSLLITAPNEDMDGSLIGSDKNKIYIFAKKGDCKDILSIENYNAQADFSGNPIDIYTVGGESVGSGNTYCAAVIATDTSNNPIEIKLKEGSLTDKELVVKPEYNEILYELSNSQSITIP